MISPEKMRPRNPGLHVAVPLVFASGAYALCAYVFGLWPLQAPAPARCGAGASHYQVFVDPTGSNRHKENWEIEAPAFAQTLGSCDVVSFWTIDDNSSSGAASGKPLEFPLLDPNAPGGVVVAVKQKIREIGRASCRE